MPAVVGGIEASRLDLVHHLPREQYLELIRSVDIALDPFPFNGHTTTCDSLWMGVPTLTLSGDAPISRSTASILATLGMGDFIAATQRVWMGPGAPSAIEVQVLPVAARLQPVRGRTRVHEADHLQVAAVDLPDAVRG